MTGAPSVSSLQQSRFAYSETDLLGKGTYASVFQAVDTEGSLGRVALKRIEFDHMVEGCPLLLLREVGIAWRLKHPNLVSILTTEFSPLDGRALIAFELMQFDLRQFLNRNGPLQGRMLCEASRQLASGLEFLHAHGVMHRDLKPQNVLVKTDSRSGMPPTLKIADFGLARTYYPRLKNFTKEVMTLWYRSPEIMLAGTLYGPKGDCWSLACLLGEMGSGKALFSGESEVAVLFKIFKTFGTPNSAANWNRVDELPHFSNRFPKWIVSRERIRETLSSLIEEDCALKTPKDRMRFGTRHLLAGASTRCYTQCIVSVMEGLFTYAPSARLSAAQARELLESALDS